MKKSNIIDKTFFCFQRNVFSKFTKGVPLITRYERKPIQRDKTKKKEKRRNNFFYRDGRDKSKAK